MNRASAWSWLDWRLAAPFVGVGAVVGILVVVRLSLDVPTATAAFPARGLVVFTTNLLPTGGSVLATEPGMLRGIKLPFLVATGAVVAGGLAASAVGTAVALRRVSAGEWVPPASVVGWLLAYALGAGAVTFGSLIVVGTWAIPPVVVSLPLLALSVVLFPTPAVIVLERTSPVTGIRRAAALFGIGPGRITVAALLVGYAGYLCTGATALGGDGSVFTYAVGAAVSTAVGGTIHAAALLWLYTRLERQAERSMQVAQSTTTE